MKKHSILVVDDDPSISKMLQAIFDLAGYDCVAVSSAKEALKVSEKKEFTIIILDINLDSDITGVDLAVILRKKFPNSKICALTGYTSLFNTISPAVAGFDKCFYKPDGIYEIINFIGTELKEE